MRYNSQQSSAAASQGCSILRTAIQRKNVEETRAAIHSGADINARWRNGYIEQETPLMLASDTGCAVIVDLLLQAGADPTAVNSSNSGGAGKLTPLHYALNPGKKETGYLEIVKSLICAGAPPDAESNNGTTPLALACETAWTEVVELLVAQGAKAHLSSRARKHPLHFAVIHGNKQIVGYLLQNGAPVDSRNEHGDSALMIALSRGREELAEFLLQEGADLQTTNDAGETTLVKAALFARDAEDEEHTKAIRLLKMLMSRGADLNAKSRNAKTAYDLVSDGYEPGAMKFLKSHGAKSGKEIP
jgi:ankyrin repeat protein